MDDNFCNFLFAFMDDKAPTECYSILTCFKRVTTQLRKGDKKKKRKEKKEGKLL